MKKKKPRKFYGFNVEERKITRRSQLFLFSAAILFVVLLLLLWAAKITAEAPKKKRLYFSGIIFRLLVKLLVDFCFIPPPTLNAISVHLNFSCFHFVGCLLVWFTVYEFLSSTLRHPDSGTCYLHLEMIAIVFPFI